MTTTMPWTRREWYWVSGVTLVAALLRFWGFGRLGLTHFDEGVYALAGLWSVVPQGIDPIVIPYAPPGFPILVGLCYTILGVGDLAAVLPATLCGIAAVPVVGWIGRRSFGPGAGAASALFCALSLAHIAFSRKALTDAPFLTTWLWALATGVWFLERPTILRAVLFGAAVGLAQNFKYNGALSGIIVATGAIFGSLTQPSLRGRSALLRVFGWGFVAALVSAMVYVPWFRFVEAHGSYAALMHHHRGYLSGPGAWPSHWRLQLDQVIALSGGTLWQAVSWVLACGLGCAVGSSRETGVVRARLMLGVAIVIGGALIGLIPEMAWWVGIWGLGFLKSERPAPRVVAASWLILSVITPFYHPYARLWLPLHACGWLMMGGIVARLLTSIAVLPRTGLSAGWRFDWIGLVVILALAGSARFLAPIRTAAIAPRSVFAPTENLRVACARIAVHPDLESPLRLLARRPVSFYLAIRGVAIQLLADPQNLRSIAGEARGWGVVDEAVVPNREDLNALGSAWRVVETFPTPLDPVTRLDVQPDSIYSGSAEPDSTKLLLLEPAR